MLDIVDEFSNLLFLAIVGVWKGNFQLTLPKALCLSNHSSIFDDVHVTSFATTRILVGVLCIWSLKEKERDTHQQHRSAQPLLKQTETDFLERMNEKDRAHQSSEVIVCSR